MEMSLQWRPIQQMVQTTFASLIYDGDNTPLQFLGWKSNGKNWLQWSHAVKLVIKERRKLGHALDSSYKEAAWRWSNLSKLGLRRFHCYFMVDWFNGAQDWSDVPISIYNKGSMGCSKEDLFRPQKLSPGFWN